jgi:hypothetical protein
MAHADLPRVEQKMQPKLVSVLLLAVCLAVVLSLPVVQKSQENTVHDLVDTVEEVHVVDDLMEGDQIEEDQIQSGSNLVCDIWVALRLYCCTENYLFIIAEVYHFVQEESVSSVDMDEQDDDRYRHDDHDHDRRHGHHDDHDHNHDHSRDHRNHREHRHRDHHDHDHHRRRHAHHGHHGHRHGHHHHKECLTFAELASDYLLSAYSSLKPLLSSTLGNPNVMPDDVHDVRYMEDLMNMHAQGLSCV